MRFLILIFVLFLGCEDDPVSLGIQGCMDESACNYDSTANIDDGSCCKPKISGPYSSSIISLGHMIVENSVTIINEGNELIQYVDYTVDYFSGVITFSHDNIIYGSQIEIFYCRNSVDNVCAGDGSIDYADNSILLYDYDFIKDKYFFIDKIFQLAFYPLNESNHHIINTNYVIKDFMLFKKSYNIELGFFQGKAYVNPLDVEDGSQFTEDGMWVTLESSDDYFIDKYLGYVRLNTTNANDVIAVYYTIGEILDGGQIVESDDPLLIGTNIDAIINQSDDELILKLIKNQGTQNPNSPTWDLMMKNIYHTGSNICGDSNYPNIEIWDSINNSKVSENGNTYLNIFGLDKFGVDGSVVEGGDGIVDYHSHMINQYCDIIFPFHMPFSLDVSLTPNYEINDNLVDNPFYWGNTHQDLSNIYSVTGFLYDIYTDSIVLNRESGETLIYNFYQYNSGPAMYFSNSSHSIANEHKFCIKINY